MSAAKNRMLVLSGRMLQVIILVRKRHGSGLVQLLCVLLHKGNVNLDFGGSQSRRGDELQVLLASQLAGQPEEGFFIVVIGLGRDVVVLDGLLAVEVNSLGLDLALLDVDLVTAEDNGNVPADTGEITVPVGDVLVSDAGGEIEHDDTAFSFDVVTIAKTSKLLLTSCYKELKQNETNTKSAPGVYVNRWQGVKQYYGIKS